MEANQASDPERRVYHEIFLALAVLFLLTLSILWLIGLGPCFGTACAAGCCSIAYDCKEPSKDLESVRRCCSEEPSTERPLWCCDPKWVDPKLGLCPVKEKEPVCNPLPEKLEDREQCCEQLADPKPDGCLSCDEKSIDPRIVTKCCYNKPLAEQSQWCCETKPDDVANLEWCCKEERDGKRPPWCPDLVSTNPKKTTTIATSVLFDFEQYKLEHLKSGGQQELDDFVSRLKGTLEPGQTLSVVGHTCRLAWRGFNNQLLSERRAATVAKYLESQLQDVVVKHSGEGAGKPTGKTEHCVRAKPYLKRKECFDPDRRVEISWGNSVASQ